MWWNPDESGWGVNVILQKDMGYIAFFVYDSAQDPVWYTSDVHLDQRTGDKTGIADGKASLAEFAGRRDYK
jgi:hypothetical protein